jgi:hypothetical protein
MYLKDDFFVYEDPNDSRDRVIRGSELDLSGYSNGELFMHEFGDGTRDLVWIDGSGTARHISEFAVSSYDASGHADNSIWVDGNTSALAWKVGGTGYQCKGDLNDAGNIHNLTLTEVETGIKIEWDTQFKDFLPQEFRLYRSDNGGVEVTDRGLIGNGHVDNNVVDNGVYSYQVREETTTINGEVQYSTTQVKEQGWEDPGPTNPPTEAPRNVSITRGGTVTDPKVFVGWEDSQTGYETNVTLYEKGYSGDYQLFGFGAVPANETSYSRAYDQNNDGPYWKAEVYYTHPDGDGPKATVTDTL